MVKRKQPTRKRGKRIKEPTFTIPRDQHDWTNVYILPSEGHVFIMEGEEGEEGSTVRGPAVIIESVSPSGKDTVPYNLGSEEPWDWLGRLAHVGSWALLNKEVAPLLPDDFVAISPRFRGTTKEQRQSMADRLPERARRKKAN